MKLRTRILVPALALAAVFGTAGCTDDDATVVSENLSKAADNFEVQRRVVMFNGITDKYLLEIQGLCSIKDEGNQLEVTCKTSQGNEPENFKKSFLGLSNNVSYFVEQLEGKNVSKYYYRVTFKPQVVVPDVDIRGGAEVPANQN